MLGAFFRIFMLLVLSGVISYVGDYMGHKAGKMKLTAFGIRPRKTSKVIAVGTGVLITVVTLLILLLFSNQAKIALLGLDKIQQDIYNLEERKIKLEQVLYDLEKRITAMKERVSIYPMVFETTQPLAYGVIKKHTSEKDIMNSLEKMKKKVAVEFYNKNDELANIVMSRGIKTPKDLNGKTIIFFNSGEFITYLKNVNNDRVVCMYSFANIFLGDDLIVGFTSQDNKLIFRKDEVIREGIIDATVARKHILEQVMILLDKASATAIDKGMVPDPKVGLGVDIPIPDMWDICDQIKSYSGNVRVRIIATENIWTLGPLKFKIEKEPVKQ
ncbi:MAG: DUF3084 domain-containing protein [Candidatus Eremiobacterota bacterium]